MILVGLAGLVAFSRVYMSYHTASQVIWGSAIGSGAAFFWFFVVTRVLRPYTFRWMTQTYLFRLFLVKDSSHICDLVLFEYKQVGNASHASHTQERRDE